MITLIYYYRANRFYGADEGSRAANYVLAALAAKEE